ncbi:MAG: peptide transporter ATP-binding protein, partial [Proteobacteria bacterium]|nr:peptide transporter ATP-binding protein [Pseudomonadota bacterium]
MSVEPLNSETLFAVEGLSKHFGGAAKGLFQKAKPVVKAVNDVSFTITKGETFGLVGESGSGKSTVARLMLRAYDVTAGSIRFRRGDGNTVELASAGKAELQALRRQMQMIFQDPYSSLNPRMTLLELVGEPLLVHGVASGSELEDRVAELLKLVGLRPEFRGRYPHAFSGGQRQRIGIARALALNPAFIAADEAVSALDVSVAAQNINLMQDLQEQFGLTYLFITHDLSMVQHISNRIGVMYVGRLMEVSATDPMFERPLHPYTEALLSAVPQPDPKRNRGRKRIMLKGEIPDASNPPTGCAFHPRCPYAKDVCK